MLLMARRKSGAEGIAVRTFGEMKERREGEDKGGWGSRAGAGEERECVEEEVVHDEMEEEVGEMREGDEEEEEGDRKRRLHRFFWGPPLWLATRRPAEQSCIAKAGKGAVGVVACRRRHEFSRWKRKEKRPVLLPASLRRYPLVSTADAASSEHRRSGGEVGEAVCDEGCGGGKVEVKSRVIESSIPVSLSAVAVRVRREYWQGQGRRESSINASRRGFFEITALLLLTPPALASLRYALIVLPSLLQCQ